MITVNRSAISVISTSHFTKDIENISSVLPLSYRNTCRSWELEITFKTLNLHDRSSPLLPDDCVTGCVLDENIFLIFLAENQRIYRTSF